MTQARIIDGKAEGQRLRQDLAQEVKAAGLKPCLATVLVGDDPASAVYVKNKSKAAKEIGITVKDHHLKATTTQAQLNNLLLQLNADPEVNGILLQLPLPKHLDEKPLLAAIAPHKDVDGFHAVNLGLLLRGEGGYPPCTPAGSLHLIKTTGQTIAGKHAVVIGRSNIVGKPVALMLLAEHATVTICHSKTLDLAAVVGQADIVVAAVGRPGLVRGDWIKPGAIVIDVGINRDNSGKLVGDVDFATAQNRAGWITPVPGGVGPMTIAYLMQNTINAYKQQTARQ